jgi:hypothetical protein
MIIRFPDTDSPVSSRSRPPRLSCGAIISPGTSVDTPGAAPIPPTAIDIASDPAFMEVVNFWFSAPGSRSGNPVPIVCASTETP